MFVMARLFTKHSCSVLTQTKVALWDSILFSGHIAVNLSTDAATALLLTKVTNEPEVRSETSH